MSSGNHRLASSTLLRRDRPAGRSTPLSKLLLAAALVSACATAGARTVAVPFWEGTGLRFTTDTYASQVQERSPGTHPLLLLVVAKGFDEPEFRKQMAVLEQINSEALNLVVVPGSATSVDKRGYWLASEDAQALLKDKRFLLLALGTAGEVCVSSTAALPRSRIVTPAEALQPELLRCAQKPRGTP